MLYSLVRVEAPQLLVEAGLHRAVAAEAAAVVCHSDASSSARLSATIATGLADEEWRGTAAERGSGNDLEAAHAPQM